MNIKKTIGISALFFGLSATAFAFPWDIDMVDSIFIRGYEKPMMTPPEGAISQNNFRPESVPNPFEGREDELQVLEQGEVAFRTYCQTCHGYKGTGQAKNGSDWPLKADGRWPTIPSLTQINKTTDILIQSPYPSETIYGFVKNGRNTMPSYTHAMSEEEIWSAIIYLKSLKGQKRTAKIGE